LHHSKPLTWGPVLQPRRHNLRATDIEDDQIECAAARSLINVANALISSCPTLGCQRVNLWRGGADVVASQRGAACIPGTSLFVRLYGRGPRLAAEISIWISHVRSFASSSPNPRVMFKAGRTWQANGGGDDARVRRIPPIPCPSEPNCRAGHAWRPAILAQRCSPLGGRCR
jgi:hypothetical protein